MITAQITEDLKITTGEFVWMYHNSRMDEFSDCEMPNSILDCGPKTPPKEFVKVISVDNVNRSLQVLPITTLTLFAQNSNTKDSVKLLRSSLIKCRHDQGVTFIKTTPKEREEYFQGLVNSMDVVTTQVKQTIPDLVLDPTEKLLATLNKWLETKKVNTAEELTAILQLLN